MFRLLQVSIAAVLATMLIVGPPIRAQAAGLSEALSSLDTGPYKDAACKATIDAVVGAVDGLGAAGFSNVKVEDDVISGDLSLPVAGDWSIYLFAPDCSKSGFAVLKPKSDLKLSDLVGSVPGLDEVDKLGLNGQIFILSNTDGSLAAESAPAAAKSALSAAANGDDGVEVEIKPGLTVLGVMDLSKSTATSKAMSFLRFKDASSKRIAIDGFLGAEMMAAWLKGNKGKADFTLAGTLADAAMTLPSVKVTPNMAAAKNNVIMAVQDTFKSYATSGFAFDGRHGILQYNRDAGKCVVTRSGKGVLSASAMKKLQQQAAKLSAAIPGLALQSTRTSSAKKQLDADRTKLAQINAKILKSQKASLISVDRCVANVSHKWTPVPIAAGTWKAK